MKKTILSALFALGLFGFTAQAQVIHKHERFVQDYKWKLTASYNMMDFNFNHTDLPEGAEMIAGGIPVKVGIGYEFLPHLSIVADFAMNEVEVGHVLHGELIADHDITITSLNGSFSYSLGRVFNIPIADPYIKAGLGHLR